jgi:uncharacterized protein with GYD domain
MAYYIMLTSLTSDGRKTIMRNPGGISDVNHEVEAMGAKIIAQYSVLGQYDFINILEAPNNNVIARVTSELGARGTLLPLTLAATTVEDLVNELETASAMKEKT